MDSDEYKKLVQAEYSRQLESQIRWLNHPIHKAYREKRDQEWRAKPWWERARIRASSWIRQRRIALGEWIAGREIEP